MHWVLLRKMGVVTRGVIDQHRGRLRTVRRVATRTTFGIVAMCATYLLLDAAFFQSARPHPTYLLLDREQRFLAEVGDDAAGMGFWPIDELPPRVVAATLALEDRRFWSHPGIDPIGVARAVQQNLRTQSRLSGASTLAMQVARLSDPRSRTYLHKLREAARAVLLTWRTGRDEVLRDYLRLVPYGNRIHGIGYAARRYLDKPVADLSWAEVAFLTAIPQSPTRMNPFREDGHQRAVARGEKILRALHDRGVLTDAEFELAAVQIRDLTIPVPPVRSSAALHAVFRIVDELPVMSPVNHAEPYRVITSLDLDLQEQVTEHAQEVLFHVSERGANNAAVIVVDRPSARVRAWVGSANYFDDARAGAIDYARARRSPGSTLKPFFYALAFERGVITPATVLDDLQAGRGGIVNVDHRYLGPMLPRQALANSRNVPAVEILNRVGLDEGYAFLRELGLHDGTQPARRYGLGMTIGALPTTLEAVVTAYGALANDGVLRPLNWREYAGPEAGQQMLSPSVARIVTQYLADPSARLPTFARMGPMEYPFPVALKTGTSQGARDAWTVAYSHRYIIGVWVGDPDQRPMHEVTGSSAAAQLAQRVLLDLHRNERQGMADTSFPAPQGYDVARVCALTGKRATDACDSVFEEWFAPGTAPVERDDAFMRVAIDARTGRRANAATPDQYRSWRTVVDLPARYGEWLAAGGIATATADGISTHAVPDNFPSPGSGMGTSGPTIEITSPRNGDHLLRDPTVPPELGTIALRAEVNPPVPEVLWLIDGQPYQLAAFPYTVRWPVRKSVRSVTVMIPSTAQTKSVRIQVD